MGRKVFLSVLGTSNYRPVVYSSKADNYVSGEVRFIQEATLNKIVKSWSKEDQIFILLTKEAHKRNWIDRIEDNKTIEGLESRLRSMNLQVPYTNVDIPVGKNEEELFKIFKNTFDCLQEGDEVYFDITHGLRYLPMLVMVLCNYSQVLKNVTLKGISYGSFETPDEDKSCPIIDLTNFALLQKWTDAAASFMNYGRTLEITDLLKKHSNVMSKGDQNKVQEFNKRLKDLEGDMYTVRGKKIISGSLFKEMATSMKQLKKMQIIPALDPLIDKIETKISNFKPSEHLLNGFYAVDWCLEHDLIQQAYTIGQETIISFVTEYYGKDAKNKEDRVFMSSIIGICGTENEDEQKWSNVLRMRKDRSSIPCNDVKCILADPLTQALSLPFQNLTSFRNTINHGGFTGAETWKALKDNFINPYKRCILILNEYGLEEYSVEKPLFEKP